MSAETITVSSSPTSDQDQVFQLQMEASKLREKIKFLESTQSSQNGTTSTMDLIQQKDEELNVKNQQLSVLNDKFFEIKKGLGAIESERAVLKKSKNDLETENKKIQRHLDIREREVSALVQRCAQQEEKIKADKDLRVTNASLSQNIRDLNEAAKKEATQKKETEYQLRNAQNQIKLYKDRNEMLEKKRKKETDALLILVKSLEKQINDKDKTLGGWSVNMEKAMRDSKEKTSKIEGLENIMKRQELRMSEHKKNVEEKSEIIKSMEKEKEDTIKLHEEQTKDLKLELAQQRTDMELNLDQTVEKVKSELNDKIHILESELNNKENELLISRTELTDARIALATMENETKLENEKVMEKIKALEETMRDESIKSDSEKEELDKQLMVKDEQIYEFKEKLDNLEKENALLKNENIALERSTKETQENNNKESLEMKNKIKKLLDEVKTLQSEKKELDSSVNAIHESMRISLSEAEMNYSKMKDTLKNELETVKKENQDIKAELEMKIVSSEKAIQKSKLDIEEREANITQISIALETTKAVAMETNSTNEKKIKDLEAIIANSNKEFAEKDVELNHVKNILLKQTSENNSILQKQILDLKEEIKNTEHDAAVIVAELEEKLNEAKGTCKRLEEQTKKAKSEATESLSTLNVEVEELKNDKKKQEEEIEMLRKKIAESEEKVASLMKFKNKQEGKFIEQRDELDQLIDAYEKSKDENKLTIARLEVEIIKLEEERDRQADDEFAYQESMEGLSEELAEAEAKIMEQQAIIDQMKESLSERTTLLGHMVSQNKDLERDLSEARTFVSDIQEETEGYVRQKEEAEKKAKRLMLELEELENSQLSRINKERLKVEKAAYEVETMKKALDRAHQETKDYNDLQKQNRELLDKIKRQEEYLKRKLQKENRLKDRINHATTTSVAQKPVSRYGKVQPRKPGPKKLFPDELEELLEDEV